MEFLPVPFLRIGVGNEPKDGGCIMQVIDWISSGGWSDDPACVLPPLRWVSIQVNDELKDPERQQLLDLAPRLINTNPPVLDADAIALELDVWATGYKHMLRRAWRGDAERIIRTIEAQLDHIVAWAHGEQTPPLPHYENYDDDVNDLCDYTLDQGPLRELNGREILQLEYKLNEACEGVQWTFDDLKVMLDRYDELTGRTDVPDLDFTGVCQAMGLAPA